MGGVCAFSNPSRWAPFMAMIVVGKGEEAVAEIVGPGMPATPEPFPDARRRFLDALKPLAGATCPGAVRGQLRGDGRIGAVKPLEPGVPPVVAKRRLRTSTPSRRAPSSKRQAESATCSSSRSARAAGAAVASASEGQVYRPCATGVSSPLRASVAEIAKRPARGPGGACVSDYPWIGELMKGAGEHGVEVSIFVAPGRQPDRRPGRLAPARRPSHAHHGARGGDRAAAPRGAEGDQRRAALRGPAISSGSTGSPTSSATS